MSYRRNIHCIALLLLAASCAPAVTEPMAAHSATNTKATPLVLSPRDGEQRLRRPPPAAISNLTVPFILKVDERNGGAEDFMVLTEDIPPGQAISPHFHPHSEEILFIHAGRGTAWLDGKEAKVEPGTMIFMPRGTSMRLVNDGAEPISLVAIFSRPGFDKYLREVSVPAGAVPKPLTAEELDSIRSRHTGAVIYKKR